MLQVALVGCAHIHTPGYCKKLNNRQDITVRYVWDNDLSRAEQYAAMLGGEVVNNVSRIWNDATTTVAIICSETLHHQSLVIGAAEAGKSIFVEKPLGLIAKDAYEMSTAIENSGVLFQTGYFMRGTPLHLFVKQLIDQGSLGTVTRIRHTNCHNGSLRGIFDKEWRWMADPAQAGAGGYLDLGNHSLDILLWLMGEVTSVTASITTLTGRYGMCDEYGEGIIKFANGTVGTLAAGWVDIANPVTLEISGTKGHAYIANNKLYLTCPKIHGAEGKAPWTDLPKAWPHAFDIFLDTISGKDHPPTVTAREAAYRCAVMEAMYESSKHGTWTTPERI